MKSDLRSRLVDPAIVLGITATVGLVSQRWTGLDTPDSSFYASLGRFGSEVSDRAFDNSYFWTRLGEIVPVHVLTSLTGTWVGFAIHRFALLLLIVASFYVAMHRFTCRPSAAYLATLASMSTVILGYLGNPYLTGAVMAGTAVALASAMSDRRSAAAIGGVALGWLVMVNPVGVLLAGVTWLVVRIQMRTRVSYLAIAAGTGALTFVAFLLAGRVVFPELNWLSTYVDANSTLKYSDFASTDLIWPKDISLIVPITILVITAIAWATHRSEPAAQRAFAISASSLAFMGVFSPIMGGIPLEGPFYQAMLWPPALFALALVMTLAVPADGWTRLQAVTGIVGLVLVGLAGRLNPGLALWAGWALAIVLTLVFLVASYKGAIGAIASVALLLAGAQLLQNSRGDLGLYYLSPYSNAYNDNPIGEKIRTAVNAQEWLLAQTTDQDTILNWVGGDWRGGDRELYVVAGMQMWGENRVTLEPILYEEDLARLDEIRPSVIQMVGPSMDSVLQFWSSIPGSLRPTAPQCYDFAWPDAEIPQGHSCLTRLDWSSA